MEPNDEVYRVINAGEYPDLNRISQRVRVLVFHLTGAGQYPASTIAVFVLLGPVTPVVCPPYGLPPLGHRAAERMSLSLKQLDRSQASLA